MRTAVVLSTLAVACAMGACDTGDIASSDGARSGPLAVGSSPLRRLSNVEYLHALEDLFPTLHPTLPPLPPDIPVAGFENAADAQKASDVLVARYETIAGLYAAAATENPEVLRKIVGCDEWLTPARAAACASELLATTGRRIFRRPLTSEERGRFLVRFQEWQTAIDFEGAVQLTLSALLQSPQFLYRLEPLNPGERVRSVVNLGPYEMATRLSFFLWESGPDAALLAAAERNELATVSQIRDAALRMVDDPRAQRVFWDFPRQWLGLHRILEDEHDVRTPEIDPSWSRQTQLAANQESELFVRNTLARGGTFRDLLTSRRAWVNGEMARVYGLAEPKNPDAWTEVLLPASERAGLLTRASFLAGFSHRGATSPPVRGNGIQLRFLCQLPVSPPPGADLSQPTAQPGDGPKTNRTLFEERTAAVMCQGCHRALNGFGFGLEAYDAAGQFRATENGLPIDARGALVGTDVDREFLGGVELSAALSESETVHACATTQLVRYALGRAPDDAELPTVAALSKQFMASQGDVRALLVAIATSPSFRTRFAEAPLP